MKAADKEIVNTAVREDDARRAVEDWESEGGAYIPGPSGPAEEEANDAEGMSRFVPPARTPEL